MPAALNTGSKQYNY